MCAVHAVRLGGARPLARYAWSRRTRDAHGRHREVGSEGRVERRCGARDTEPDRRGGPLGASGHATAKPAIHRWGVLDRIRRLGPDGMTADPGSAAGCPRCWGRRAEESALTAPAAGRSRHRSQPARSDGPNGRAESRPGVKRRDRVRRGVGRCSAAGSVHARLARRETPRRWGGSVHLTQSARTAGDVTRRSGGVGGGRP